MPERLTLPIHGPEHVRGGPDPIPSFAIYQIEVFEPNKPVIVEDESFEWEIPEDLDGARLVKVDGYLTTAGGSTLELQLSKLYQGDDGTATDILTTKLSIPAGEVNAKEGSPAVISTDDDIRDFQWGDHIRVDIDAAGGGKGLGLICYFLPSTLAAVIFKGEKGDPGGVNSWEGEYDSGATYVTNNAVSNGGSSYVAIVDNPTLEPGVDPGWETEWMLLAQVQNLTGIDFVIDGAGYPVDIGVKGFAVVKYDCTILECSVLGQPSGSIVVDIWKDTYANFPPTDADSITGAEPPTLVSEAKSIDTILTGWTTALAEGDILLFNVDSCSGVEKVTVSLKMRKD